MATDRPTPDKCLLLRGEDAAAIDDGNGPTIDDLQRLRLNREVHRDLLLYASTGNALPLWRAYRRVRQAGAPVPELILAEFDRMAQALTHAAPTDFLGAMKLRSKSRPGQEVRELAEAEAGLNLVSRVENVRAFFGISENEARDLIAKEDGVTFGAVKRAHQRRTNPPPMTLKTDGADTAPTARPRNSIFDNED